MMDRRPTLNGAAQADVGPWRTRTVVLVDDHPIVAFGLRIAFQATQRFLLAEVAANPAEAVLAIERQQPDIVIADLVFGALIEIGLIRTCRRLLPSSTILVFSSLPPRFYERDVLKAGADRLVPKEETIETLIAALENLELRPMARRRAETRANGAPDGTGPSPGGGSLTRREVEIGRRLSMGVSVARIGDDLGVSAKTVAVHRDNIRRKLNCRDSAELIARLARLFPPEICRD